MGSWANVTRHPIKKQQLDGHLDEINVRSSDYVGHHRIGRQDVGQP